MSKENNNVLIKILYRWDFPDGPVVSQDQGFLVAQLVKNPPVMWETWV